MIRKLRQKQVRNEKGFTLIELMIVVAIIGILAAIAIPQFSAYRERSYIASMKADCNAVRTAEEAYFVDNDKYLAITETAEGVAPTGLADYGVKSISAGNKVAVAASTNINKDFKVTVTSTKTTKSTVYDSTTGQTVTS